MSIDQKVSEIEEKLKTHQRITDAFLFYYDPSDLEESVIIDQIKDGKLKLVKSVTVDTPCTDRINFFKNRVGIYDIYADESEKLYYCNRPIRVVDDIRDRFAKDISEEQLEIELEKILRALYPPEDILGIIGPVHPDWL